MTLSRIFLFTPFSQYSVLNVFTQNFSDALNRQGIQTRVFPFEKQDFEKFHQLVQEEKPDCTLSFNGILPDANGRFLCDYIQIPHVAYLVDSPLRFFELTKSSRNIIVCIDQDFCQILREYNFPYTLFLPHAVDRYVTPLENSEWLYDVVMLGSFIDHEEICKEWPERYGKELTELMHESATCTLIDPAISYFNAFLKVIQREINAGKALDVNRIDFDLFNSLESYIQGKSHIELLSAIDGVEVHLFGAHGKQNWKSYLKGLSKSIHLHESVPFPQVLEIMKRTKILLNATPKFKKGLHERVLNGLACGTVVLAHETSFLKDSFKDEEEILLYSPNHWDEMNRKLQLYLNDDTLHRCLASNGRNKVLKEHTWDHRAKTLIKALSVILADSC